MFPRIGSLLMCIRIAVVFDCKCQEWTSLKSITIPDRQACGMWSGVSDWPAHHSSLAPYLGKGGGGGGGGMSGLSVLYFRMYM